MIKGFTPRLYQETIFSTCVSKNTLVVLPTGLGKTNVFLMLAAYRLKQYPNSKILFIGPTRPLISQYKEVFLKNFEIDENKLTVFTGQVSPKKRAELWRSSQIIFSTPQGLENDIIAGRIDLSAVSLLGVDEAHRAVKEYSYVWIAREYERRANYPRILALTASPGSDNETIEEVCRNLYIEDIEVRTQEDPDVKPYVKEIKLVFKDVDLPDSFLEAKKYLETCYKSKLEMMKQYGYTGSVTMLSKRDLLSIQSGLISEMNQGSRDYNTLKSLSLIAEVMKVSHGLELLESQGIRALSNYMDKLITQARSSKTKAVKNLVRDENFKSAHIKVERMIEDKIEHPKFAELRKIVKKTMTNPSAKIIVFTQFRDTAVEIAKDLNEEEEISAKIFVGQQKKGETGLTQKKQIEMLDEFRKGLFNTIIMTSVGEEGLDIPSVDQVVFFEPVPSVIRHIQRRGRTGRQDKGEVIVLVAKKTRDEAYRWSTKHKEKRMYKTLDKIKNNFTLHKREEIKLDKFIDDTTVFVDYREKGNKIIKLLIDKGVQIKLEKLETADYILSKRVGIEYKCVEDFISSILDGRLMDQVKELKRNFERPLIVIEGTTDLYSVRNVHPNAIKGMLATITVSFGVPILYTKNSAETADLFQIIAKREAEEKGKDYNMHGDKKPFTLKEQQEYIVSSFPSVGPSIAKELLSHFGSVKKIMDASEQELLEVEKIGKKITRSIKDVLDKEYDP